MRAPLPAAGGAQLGAGGAVVTIAFDEPLGVAPVDPATFSVMSGGEALAVSGISVAGSTATLTLATAVAPRASVTIAYADPVGDQPDQVLQDLAGNDVADFALTLTRLPAISGQVYHWKSHVLLADTVVTATGSAQSVDRTTPADGNYVLSDLADDAYTLSLQRQTVDSVDAIDAGDALAALKLAVGRNPNGADTMVSPYQFIAADVTGDGVVDAQDALGILKMVVGRTGAPAREWLFVREEEDFWDNDRVSLNSGFVDYDRQPSVAVLGASEPSNFVAVLRGDIDGNWVPGGTPAQTLSSEYFLSLASRLGVPLDFWG
jgi:uncharacterized repeat protein (TIGR02059 family)